MYFFRTAVYVMSIFTPNTNIMQWRKAMTFFFLKQVKHIPTRHDNQSGPVVTAWRNNGGPRGCLCVPQPCPPPPPRCITAFILTSKRDKKKLSLYLLPLVFQPTWCWPEKNKQTKNRTNRLAFDESRSGFSWMTMRCTKPRSVSLAAFAEMVQEVLEHVAAVAIVIVTPYRNPEN